MRVEFFGFQHAIPHNSGRLPQTFGSGIIYYSALRRGTVALLSYILEPHMNPVQASSDRFYERGMSPLGLLFILIIFIFLLFLFDQAFILNSQCNDSDSVMECALDILLGSDDEGQPQEGSVTATGVISGEYGGENRSVSVSMHIPLAGGEVTGSFSGDCDGTIKGTYAGGGGSIRGSGKGSCAFVIPASGNFSGTVNESSKTVPVRGSGSAAGFSGEGSLTLTY